MIKNETAPSAFSFQFWLGESEPMGTTVSTDGTDGSQNHTEVSFCDGIQHLTTLEL